MSDAAKPGTSGFDPAQHENQLVAVFEEFGSAQAARDALLGTGLPAESIELSALDEGEATELEAAPSGLWSTLGRLFAPHDEAEDLGQALGRGHVMVVVHPADDAARERAIEVLEGCGPLDLDARRAEWREHAATSAKPDETPKYVRIVEERVRVGWRERPSGAAKVRSYVAPREGAGPTHRVELQEEEIGQQDAPH